MADQIYKVRDPQGNIREIKGPAGASDEEVIAQAKTLFAVPAQATPAVSYPHLTLPPNREGKNQCVPLCEKKKKIRLELRA